MYINNPIECIDYDIHTSCLYRNIYYINNTWIIFTNNYIEKNDCVNIYAHVLSECWKPIIYPINILNSYIKKNRKNYDGLTIPLKLTYNKNYGHALWDDLYSVYTSVVKFGYKDHPFYVTIPNDRINKKNRFIKDIYETIEKFSKKKIIFLNKNETIPLMFKNFIVGSSHQCQRCVNVEYSLKYSREYNTTKLIRDRMYQVFNIYPVFTEPLNGVIIHNKRYSPTEIIILKNIVEYYNKNKSGLIELHYIDFRNYPSLYEQIKLLSKVHVYISGPGTGLLNFPFIADPGVVINLGHIHFGCPQYLEQYMLEGSPHIKAYYYAPKKRMEAMNFTYITYMIDEAVNYINKHKSIYIEKEENLNEIGKLFVKICKKYKKICNDLIKNYDWGYGKCRGVWAENMIYFPSLYKRNPEIVNIVKKYNNTYEIGCKIGSNFSPQIQCK